MCVIRGAMLEPNAIATRCACRREDIVGVVGRVASLKVDGGMGRGTLRMRVKPWRVWDGGMYFASSSW
jgi:hypothetical protein